MRQTRFSLWLLLILLSVSPSAHAWWNEEWPSRVELTVDAGITGGDIQETAKDFPLLVRLHAGNFGYFFELAENGRDLRFLQQDKAALKYTVEKLDPLTELGLIWVKVPSIRGGFSTDGFTLYYGNPQAADGSDAAGVYDADQSLVYHFNEQESLPQDATAHGIHASSSRVVIDPNGHIAAAARFEGAGGITIDPHPAIAIDPENGWTFSSWIKTEQEQTAAVLQARDSDTRLTIDLQNGLLQTSYHSADGSMTQTDPVRISLGKWQHLALVARADTLQLYLDGQRVAEAAIVLESLLPTLQLGAADSGLHLTGWLDEVQIAKIARSPDWIKLQYRSQSPDYTLLSFGYDESSAGGGVDYFTVILENLTIDGWVVIALCAIMLVISLLVMIGKGLTLKQARQDNAAFLEQYRSIRPANLDILDRKDSANEADREIENSEFLSAIIGKHDHFQGSPLYRVYHVGVQELHKRVNGGNGSLSTEALNVIRTRLDAAVVREYQKLNKNMVLLTISISGGPFLGLLGTVMGVMITFAVIAATGNVDINSIAPGVSAALAATVAGLAVAIPTLFAYNYLLVQIKDISADMHVFTDEFLAVVSERIADRHREN